jgi:outer membrane protein TolC
MTKGVRDEVVAIRNPPHSARRSPRRGRTLQYRVQALSLAALSALGTATFTLSSGCNSYDPPPFDPRDFTREENRRAVEVNRTPITTQPLGDPGPIPRFQPPGAPTIPTVDPVPRVRRGSTTLPTTIPTTGQSVEPDASIPMTLQDVIQRSVAGSHEVRVASYDPGINALRVVEAEARYDPAYFARLQYDRADNQTAGSTIGDPDNPFSTILIDAERSDVAVVETGVRQLLLSGGEARMSVQLQKNDFEPRRTRINPYYESQIRLELQQPLLRDFGPDVNSARITIARNDARISLLDFRRVLEDNLSELERRYWELYQAEQDLKIQEVLLQRTIETYSTLLSRWEVGGDASLIPVRQAESAVKARQATLIAAKQRIRDLSAEIKRRMNDPKYPVGSPGTISTLSTPLAQPVNFSYDELIQTAQLNRLEPAQQLLRINSAGTALRVAQNARLPRLDLILSGGFNGVEGNVTASFDQLGEFNHFTYQVGLQFELPIGNRAARAVYRRAQLQRLQAIWEYKNVLSRVSFEVEVALNDIYSNWEQVKARRDSRIVKADELRLYQEQEDIGGRALDPNFVNLKLQAQQELAAAASAEAAAIAAYNIAIQRLERAKGTLLKYNNVVVEDDYFPGRDAK